MKREGVFYLEDILECMNKIENYTSDMTFDQFEQNKLIIDAVIRNLEVIGEAAKHISRKYKIKVHQFPLEKYCRT